MYVYKDGFADRMNTIYPAVYPDSIFLRKGFSFSFFFCLVDMLNSTETLQNDE